jgi:phage FluMu gp28-like protein
VSDAAGILLPYQVRWVRDPAQVMIWEKSRRIGASYCDAYRAALHAADPVGGNTYYLGYNQDMTRGYIEDAATWARALHAGASEIGETVLPDGDRQIKMFELSIGAHHVRALTSSPRGIRGKGRPGDVVVIDEAAFHDELQELLKAALAVTTWGGQVRILSTHNGADNPFAALIDDVRAGRYDYSVHRTTLDDAIDDGLYRKIAAVTGAAWSEPAQADWRAALVRRYRPNEDEELFAIPRQGGGAYLPRALVEACMPPADESGPVLRYEGSAALNALPEPVRATWLSDWIEHELAPVVAGLDEHRRHVVGADIARTGDMTSIVLLELGADLRRTWRALVELRNVPYAQQRQVLHWMLARVPRFSGAAIDAGGVGAQLAEETADSFGFGRIQQIRFSQQIYREAFPRYRAGLEDRTTVLVRDDDVLDDHRAVELVRGVPMVPQGKTDRAGQRHGDSAIAGLLANMAADAPAGPLEWEPVARGAEIARGLGELRDELDPWADPRGLV